MWASPPDFYAGGDGSGATHGGSSGGRSVRRSKSWSSLQDAALAPSAGLAGAGGAAPPAMQRSRSSEELPRVAEDVEQDGVVGPMSGAQQAALLEQAMQATMQQVMRQQD
jgi:hypothetical protein